MPTLGFVLSALCFYSASGGTTAAPLRQTANVCSSAALKAMCPRMRRLAEQQPEIDRSHDEFTPQLWNDDVELVPHLGRVRLGERIGRTAYALVFLLASDPNYIIKYKTNCDHSTGKLHPLLADFWLGYAAWKAGIAPAPIFVSPAAVTKGSRSRKVMFSMESAALAKCGRDGAVVRFMVMQRAGTCLNRYVATPDMGRAIGLGNKIISVLRTLHVAGIFHGDVHAGNICESRHDREKLLLIDFELGGFTESESDAVLRRGMQLHEVLTPWQIQSHSFARRDDLYKTMEAIGFLSCGPGFWTQPRALAEAGERVSLLAWKTSGSPFRTPVFDPIDNLTHVSVDDRGEIARTLHEVVTFIRALVSVKSVIPYDPILTQLRGVRNIIAQLASTSTTPLPPTTRVFAPTTWDAYWWIEPLDKWNDTGGVEPVAESGDGNTGAFKKRKRDDPSEPRGSAWDKFVDSWLFGTDETGWELS